MFARNVLPHNQLGAIRNGEHAHVLALVHARIEQVPNFRPLRLGIPLAEFIAKRKHALLGPRLFLVAARSEEHTSELQSLMRISYAVFCLKKKKKQLRKNRS